MDSKSEKPLHLLLNPFAIWTDLALKTGQAMWASTQAAAARSETPAPKVAVIPTADALAPSPQEPVKRPARKTAKRVRSKAPRAKRSKARGKRRAKR
jgi:hypothetical protein